MGRSKEQAARDAGISTTTWKRVEDGLNVHDTSLSAVLKVVGFDESGHADEGAPPPPSESDVRAAGTVRYVVEGVYGVKSLVVEGPVANLAELEASVDRIMRRMQDAPKDQGTED